MDSLKDRISIFVHGNTLKLQALKFYFCAFGAFLRPYQHWLKKVLPPSR